MLKLDCQKESRRGFLGKTCKKSPAWHFPTTVLVPNFNSLISHFPVSNILFRPSYLCVWHVWVTVGRKTTRGNLGLTNNSDALVWSTLGRIECAMKENVLPQSTKSDWRLFIQLSQFGSFEEKWAFQLVAKESGLLQQATKCERLFSQNFLSNRWEPARLKHCFSKAGTLAGTVGSGHLTDASLATLSLRQAGGG